MRLKAGMLYFSMENRRKTGVDRQVWQSRLIYVLSLLSRNSGNVGYALPRNDGGVLAKDWPYDIYWISYWYHFVQLVFQLISAHISRVNRDVAIKCTKDRKVCQNCRVFAEYGNILDILDFTTGHMGGIKGTQCPLQPYFISFFTENFCLISTSISMGAFWQNCIITTPLYYYFTCKFHAKGKRTWKYRNIGSKGEIH